MSNPPTLLMGYYTLYHSQYTRLAFTDVPWPADEARFADAGERNKAKPSLSGDSPRIRRSSPSAKINTSAGEEQLK